MSGPERIQPFNIEAEQALLGALLLNNDIADRLAGLEAEHFYDPVHERIYGLAMRRIAQAQRADAVALKMLLAGDEGLAQLGGTDYLARLAGAAISIVAAPDYARIITDLAARRRTLAALQDAQQALPTAEDPSEVMAALEAALAGEEAGAGRESGIGLASAMERAIAGMNEAFQGDGPTGISLGIPALEEVIGKARPGDYILIAGRPGMGKSSVASVIAHRAALQGTAVVYWCHEMAPEDNAERMLTAGLRDRGGRISYRDARAGRMSEAEFRSLIALAHDMRGLPVHFIEPSIRRMARLQHEIRRHVRRFQRQGRFVLIVLDYLQQIDPGGRTRYESVSDASMGMKALAMELRVPVLVLSQLSRRVEDRDPPRPMLSDLRDSGQLEQDANTVLLLHRDEVVLQRAIEGDPEGDRAVDLRRALDRCQGLLEIIVAKQRSGPLCTVRVGFDGASSSLYEWGTVAAFPEGHGEFRA